MRLVQFVHPLQCWVCDASETELYACDCCRCAYCVGCRVPEQALDRGGSQSEEGQLAEQAPEHSDSEASSETENDMDTVYDVMVELGAGLHPCSVERLAEEAAMTREETGYVLGVWAGLGVVDYDGETAKLLLLLEDEAG